MKTTSRRRFLSFALLGATCMTLCGFKMQAQFVDDFDAIMARSAVVQKTTTQLENLSISPSTVRVGDNVTIKAQLFYRQQTGPRPRDYVVRPLPSKQLEFNVGFKPKQVQYPSTDRNGWASATFKVPNDLNKRVNVTVAFGGDGQFKPDKITGHFDVIK